MAVRTEDGADPHGPWTAIIGLIITAIVVVTVISMEVLYYKVQDDEVLRKVMGKENADLIRNRAEQLENLNSFHWLDRSADRVAIPITAAMDLVVREERMIGDQ